MQPLGHRSFSNGKVLVINIHGMMNLTVVLYEKDPTKYCAKLFSFFFLSFFLIKRDLLKQRHAKLTERFRVRRFGVILSPLSRENQFMNADI